MKTILITGASGFIGYALASALSKSCNIIGLYNHKKPDSDENIIWKKIDLLCAGEVNGLIHRYSPDIIIHCAAIAHQGVLKADKRRYFAVNSTATMHLANAVAAMNTSTRFIYISSISVYGETRLPVPVSESHGCRPTGDYGKSKRDAEIRLLDLYRDNNAHSLIILRLAPVYDKHWSVNLDRRVLAPFKSAYLKYGTGTQKMSAIARRNVVDFIKYIILNPSIYRKTGQIINVTDKDPYTFNDIIDTFLQSRTHPVRPVIRIPEYSIFLVTRILGLMLPSKKDWIHGCYEKLASSLIFDNNKMLEKGFMPKHDLKTIFL